MEQKSNRMPLQTYFIVGNEACERFSYYGVLSILTAYITHLFTASGVDNASGHAKETVHWFKMACYVTPLIGAWIADRYWGRYHTILWISLAYCAGHAVLSVGEGHYWGLFAGLALLAIGSGGIKPCVSAFAGDQFVGDRAHLVHRIYNWFYWAINFGAFFAFLYIPQIASSKSPMPFGMSSYGVAFLLPGIAMGLALLIFWLGNRLYVKVPPEKDAPPIDPATKAEDRRTLWRIVGIFATVPFFWALFDQQHTTWVQQGKHMIPFHFLGSRFDGQTMQSVNAILILVYVPLFTLVLYPVAERMGLKLTLLRKMGAGFFLAGASFLAAAWVQSQLDAKVQLSVGWQFLQYGIMTAGEVLISTTGLAFAFTQAPARLKSTIMSFWTLTVAAGNGFAALMTNLNTNFLKWSAYHELLFYAAVVVVAGLVFVVSSRNFKTQGGE